MLCKNCHRTIELGYEFCPYCGTKQDPVKEPAMPISAPPQVNINRDWVVTGPYDHYEESESGDYSIHNRVDLNDIVELYIPDKVVKIGANALAGAKRLKSVFIPQGVTEIEAGAFKDCPQLHTVIMAPSVVAIGEEAFANCPSLHRLVIPPNATISWKGMNAIENIDVASSTVYKQIGANLILTRDGTKLVHVHLVCTPWQEHLGRPGRQCTVLKLEIPPTVTTIGSYAFDDCFEYNDLRDELYQNRLGSITLPEGVAVLEEYAFANSGFTAINLPESVTMIGDHAFKDCIYLENIGGLESVAQVGKDICAACIRLKETEGNQNQ